MRVRLSLGVAVGVVGSLGAAAHAGVVLGQVDEFGADTAGWDSSFGVSTTTWIDSGGPDGAADAYMRVSSAGGSGPGSRLGAWNQFQWSGDYIAQGVTRIEVDMVGLTGPGAEMRLMFLSNSGGVFTTAESVFVPTDGVWRTYTFDISEGGIVQVGGLPGYADSFIDVGRMHLRHQPGDPAGLGGAPAYAGSIGVDNIRAVPGTGTIGLIVCAGLGAARRRRCKAL